MKKSIKFKFPIDIIKYTLCIVLYIVLIFYILKDVIIKDILSNSMDSETFLAFLLILFSVMGGIVILPRYLKTSIKQWKVLITGKGHREMAKSLLEDMPQVTFLWANSDGATIGTKSPYIEDDETFVLTDSKDLLAKKMFELSFKNKLNIYYHGNISKKELKSFFENCLYYGFTKFSYITGNGTLELQVEDVVDIQMSFVERSEADFLHNYYIYNQKNLRKQEMEKAGIVKPDEIEKVGYYLKRSADAFNSALFFALCCCDKNEANTLYISDKASAIMSRDNVAELRENINNISIETLNKSDASILNYLFSNIDNAKIFIENSGDLSFYEDIKKWEAMYKSIEHYNEREQSDIISTYKYYCRLEEIRKKISNSSFCIITGEELKTIQKRYLFNMDCMHKITKGEVFSIPEQIFMCDDA